MHTTPAPVLSLDGKFWMDPTDGRTVPVVRGGSDNGPAVEPGAAAPNQDPAPSVDPGTQPPGGSEPEHQFQSIDDAVAALKETRQEAAARRIEAKELKSKVEKFDSKLAGYRPEEIDYLLDVFHDLSDPQAQKRAAKELAEIAEKVLGADGPPVRPTGEEDPDEKPLTKKEWQRLQAEKDQEAATAQALKELERSATEAGYPPDSPGYTLLLSYMIEPEVAGDVAKAAEKVKEYEQGVVERYRKAIEEQGQKWPGAPSDQAGQQPPADPESGPPVGWGKARQAAKAFLSAKAGQA